MSLPYIRKYYGVPAKRGGRVAWKTATMPQEMVGTITSARGARIMVRPDTGGRRLQLHPTCDIRYLENNASDDRIEVRDSAMSLVENEKEDSDGGRR